MFCCLFARRRGAFRDFHPTETNASQPFSADYLETAGELEMFCCLLSVEQLGIVISMFNGGSIINNLLSFMYIVVVGLVFQQQDSVKI